MYWTTFLKKSISAIDSNFFSKFCTKNVFLVSYAVWKVNMNQPNPSIQIVSENRLEKSSAAVFWASPIWRNRRPPKRKFRLWSFQRNKLGGVLTRLLSPTMFRTPQHWDFIIIRLKMKACRMKDCSSMLWLFVF